jgi:hypothetical protein
MATGKALETTSSDAAAAKTSEIGQAMDICRRPSFKPQPNRYVASS